MCSTYDPQRGDISSGGGRCVIKLFMRGVMKCMGRLHKNHSQYFILWGWGGGSVIERLPSTRGALGLRLSTI